MSSEIEQMGSLEEALFMLVVAIGILIWYAIKNKKNKDKGDKND